MEAAAILNAIFFIAVGIASGSVLYSVYLPKLIKGVDVTVASADKNPGAYNAFVFGGIPVGILCLLLDIFKGYVPVVLAKNEIPPDSIVFAAVLLAPVAGHAFSPLRRFHGGKGISVSFGVLLALLPEQFLVFVLAAAYLISLLLPLHINERRTVAAFSAFALAAFLLNGPISLKLGCLLIALLVNYKNWRDANIPIPFWNQRRE
jgi:acyl phosphate:glycerol-3-phosphate acyltransferase